MARLDPTGVSRILSYIKTWVTTALGGKANSSHSHTKSQITDFPTIPSSTSQLTNDSGYITSSGSCNYANSAGSAGSVAWSNVTGKPTIPTNTSQLTNDMDFLHPGSGIKVVRATSISSSGSGYWAAMCNSTADGSPTLPTTGAWWHVLSMDWSGSTTDVTNWCSQLALPTQNGSCLYWRRNDASDTSINSSTWHKVIDDTNIGSQSVNYANSAGKADYLGDIGSTDRNGASGTGWYSVGFSYSYDEGHNELAINNYWGIRLNCRDSDHVTINGNRIIDSGNIGSQSVNYANYASRSAGDGSFFISGYQLYVG